MDLHVQDWTNYPACLTVLTVSEQKIFGSSWAPGTKLSGLPSVQSVVNAVLRRVYELDDPLFTHEKSHLLLNNHWNHYRGSEERVLGLPFPVHALISVDSIETANDVVDYLNKVFEHDRARYPKKNGWHATVAHSRASLQLDRNHPFFRFKESGIIDSRCHRFLVVSDMAVEGMNNRYLAVWGAAEHCASQRKVVQRIGRPLRSAAQRQGAQLIIPPASHDQIYIFTHESFESAPNALGERTSTARTICGALAFIGDMHRATADMLTLDEYVEMDVGEHELREDPHSAQLSRWIRYAIAVQVGESMQQGRRPQVARIVRNFGGDSALRRRYVRAYAESALNNRPTPNPLASDASVADKDIDAVLDLKTKVLRVMPPEASDVLEAERTAVREMDMQTAENWVMRFAWGPTWAERRLQGEDLAWLQSVNQLAATLDGAFDRDAFDVRQTPAARLTQMADEIGRQLTLGSPLIERVQELVFEGAMSYLHKLNALTLDEFDERGRYCRPEITFALRAERFVSQLQGWVCFMLLKEGHLDALWAVLRFERFWEKE